MSIVNGVLSVTCSQCGQTHDFNADEAEFEGSGSYERQMGTENQYTWETSFNCDCENQIDITYDVWEYPMGAFNYATVEVTGGSADSEFGYDFSDEPEPDEFDEPDEE